MQSFIEALESVVSYVGELVWSPVLILLCLLSGIFFTILTRFLQVRHLKEMLKLLFKGGSSDSGVTSFQAFALSISGRVGTGNIAGVATAIALGGPGALFWMWTIAFLGAGSAYVESVLAQIYKEKVGNEYRGGPAYYIEKGLGKKWYGVLFAVITMIAMGVLMPGIQSNSIAAGVKTAFGLPSYITGIIIVGVLTLIVFGGVKRISKAAEIIVPFMATAYILVSLIIIALNITELPRVFSLIISSAFSFNATFGGIFGMAVQYGVKRGIYSNEAGQGTGPHAAAAAEVSHPTKQGLVQAFSVYVDTLFVCSATGFMILITGMYNVYDAAGKAIVEYLPGVEMGPAFTQNAVESVFPGFGSPFVAISLFFFAFTTIMAYYYISECNVAYLTRGKDGKLLLNVFRFVFILSVFGSTLINAGLVWKIGDIGVGLMAWLNIIAIFLLRKPALIALRDYEQQKKLGIDPVFNPLKLGIKNATFWENYTAQGDEKSA